MARTLQSIILLVVPLLVGCGGTQTPSGGKVKPPTQSAPDFSKLKEGMTLAEARAIWGAEGRLRENSTPEEAIYDFDFDGKSIILTVRQQPEPAVVTRIQVNNHGKTVQQIQAERAKKWAEWVKAHSDRK